MMLAFFGDSKHHVNSRYPMAMAAVTGRRLHAVFGRKVKNQLERSEEGRVIQWVSWLDYPTLLTGLQTGHPLEVLGRCCQSVDSHLGLHVMPCDARLIGVLVLGRPS